MLNSASSGLGNELVLRLRRCVGSLFFSGSTAGIVGSLLGAAYGIEGIPEPWPLQDISPRRDMNDAQEARDPFVGSQSCYQAFKYQGRLMLRAFAAALENE